MNLLLLLIIKIVLSQYGDPQCQSQVRQQCNQCNVNKCQAAGQSKSQSENEMNGYIEKRLNRNKFKTWDEMALAKIEHVMKQKEALQHYKAWMNSKNQTVHVHYVNDIDMDYVYGMAVYI